MKLGSLRNELPVFQASQVMISSISSMSSKLQGPETQDSPRGGWSKGFAAKSWRAELGPPGLCQLELQKFTAWGSI